MFYYVYILQSGSTIYIGYTVDLKQRITEHNRGKAYFTSRKSGWHLIFYEAYLNKLDAKRREKYLKTNQGSRLLKRMLKEYFYETKH